MREEEVQSPNIPTNNSTTLLYFQQPFYLTNSLTDSMQSLSIEMVNLQKEPTHELYPHVSQEWNKKKKEKKKTPPKCVRYPGQEQKPQYKNALIDRTLTKKKIMSSNNHLHYLQSL